MIATSRSSLLRWPAAPTRSRQEAAAGSARASMFKEFRNSIDHATCALKWRCRAIPPSLSAARIRSTSWIRDQRLLGVLVQFHAGADWWMGTIGVWRNDPKSDVPPGVEAFPKF